MLGAATDSKLLGSRLAVACSIVVLGPGAGVRADVRGAVVEMWAAVSEAVPRVTLHWNSTTLPVTGITVYRRAPGGSWGAGQALSPSALSWVDPDAFPNTLYEYRVVRTHNHPEFSVAEGRLWSGVNLPATEHRGTIILVIESGMVAPLSAELDRLTSDLVGDGWKVLQTHVSRHGTPLQVWDAIHGWYATNPSEFKAVLLLGRVPVPYSGMICPDGHDDPPPEPNHRGAWPTDAFYGDMDAHWPDATVTYTLADVAGTRNHNVPGDGKFDVSLLTGQFLPEMAVGRVDFANLGGIAAGLSEIDLMRRYLDRHHAFRHRLPPFATLGERALVDDDLFGPEWSLPTASSGWASGIALFGNGNTAAGEWVTGLRDQDHLLAYGCGPGAFNGAGGVSTSADFRDTRCRAVFNLLFGSYFGDWDSTDNYLRAPLVGRSDSHGLVSLWSGHPRWQLFPLAAGGTLADAYHHAIREVNQPEGPFPPDSESWDNPDQCHVAILGDPVLRSHPVKPVEGLGSSVSGYQVTLSWTLPTGESNRLGCRVYRATDRFGPYSQVGAQTPVNATSFVDTVPHPGTWFYRVRLVKRQTTASASYDNLAQGISASAEVSDSGYAAWSAGLSDPSDAGDPNRDEVPNLLAYALGASGGMVSASGNLPRIGADRRLSVAYSGKSDVTYEVLLSRNLAQWYVVAMKPVAGGWVANPASGYPHQANISLSGSGEWTFADSTPGPACFWRLRVHR